MPTMSLKRKADDLNVPDAWKERSVIETRLKDDIKSMRTERWSNVKSEDQLGGHRANGFWRTLIARSITKAYRKNRISEAKAGVRLRHKEDKEWRWRKMELTTWKA